MPISETARHFFGHGQTWLFTRTAGGAAGKALVSLPEVDSLSVAFETTKVERMSKRDALASLNLSVVEMVKATFTLECSQHVADLIALYIFGTKSTIAGGAFVNQNFPTGILAGETHTIPGERTNITTWASIVDSAGSPLTLVRGVDYEDEAEAGVVRFNNVPGTQPYRLNGTEAPSMGVGLIQTRVQEVWLRHKPINIAENDKVEPVDLYRCQIDAASTWNLLGDGNEPNKYSIAGQLLKDTTKSSTAIFGQYGRWRQPN